MIVRNESGHIWMSNTKGEDQVTPEEFRDYAALMVKNGLRRVSDYEEIYKQMEWDVAPLRVALEELERSNTTVVE